LLEFSFGSSFENRVSFCSAELLGHPSPTMPSRQECHRRLVEIIQACVCAGGISGLEKN
jgi:hypothetical protein